MSGPNAEERTLGRLRAAENRLRLLCPNGEVTAENRGTVEMLTATVAECRATLRLDVEPDEPRRRRDIDE